ncbi:MOSC domain-containing protein [Sulfurovum sp. XGS-02]|uniref:MOSC domain-containing protein n=1 Tax=Sulfurovum sp. XGS-02 TaxID=2925411 RepID=UPI00201617B3|nr:MOSC domain-containing protein [Sulfurovum sp. XGS-02]UPT77597.1 MOSC domain-containing protein [Sulfurovum sp. XGS-02]
MKNVGKVTTLFISVQGTSSRIEKKSFNLDPKGVIEDKYYDTNINRSVLLTSEASYALASGHNITFPFGSLGENILMDYNPYHLVPGDQLRIGEVVLEISQNCTMCDHLSQIDESLPTLLKNDRGIFAKVIEGGTIKKGDEITLL